MALSSYSNLKTTIANWLARTDLTTVLDDFIDLAEARIARDLRVEDMVTALSSTISSGTLTVPTGFLEFTSVYIDGTPARRLNVTNPDTIYRRYPERAADSKPYYIAKEGSSFIFGPYPDSDYTVKGSYYKKLDPLGDGTGGTVTTNFLTDEAPDVILYGALVASAPYLLEDPRIQMWESLYQSSVQQANMRDKSARFGDRVSLVTRAV